MRDYAKTGGKVGRPAYRTPASFIARKIFKKLIKICAYGQKQIKFRKEPKYKDDA